MSPGRLAQVPITVLYSIVVQGEPGPEAGTSLPSWGPKGLEAALRFSLEPLPLKPLSSCQVLFLSRIPRSKPSGCLLPEDNRCVLKTATGSGPVSLSSPSHVTKFLQHSLNTGLSLECCPSTNLACSFRPTDSKSHIPGPDNSMQAP